ILAKQWPAFIKTVSRRQIDSVHDFFLDLRHPFWSFHYTLTSDAAPSEMAIIGDTRIADILANVLLPYFLAEGADVWPIYEKLPARLTNRRLETGATRRSEEHTSELQSLRHLVCRHLLEKKKQS